MQTEGPAVDIIDPSRHSIEIVVPKGADRLGFVFVAAKPEVVHIVRVMVPLQGDPSRLSWGSRPSGNVKADAGDDQVGLVGHRVTLNGSRSRPGDGKNARWLQIAGPRILAPQQEGPFFSFVPTSTGLHRFFLIVAHEGELSEPDEVTVLIGSPPGQESGLKQAASPLEPPAAPPAPSTPEQVLAAALPRLSLGNRLASDVADVMESIARGATLYGSFAVLQNELGQRLDVVIPSDPAIRGAWNQSVFSPLTVCTTSELLGAGLDVRQPQGLNQPLTRAQQEKLSDYFDRLSRAFRAGSAMR
jgi:hypothetical protein